MFMSIQSFFFNFVTRQSKIKLVLHGIRERSLSNIKQDKFKFRGDIINSIKLRYLLNLNLIHKFCEELNIVSRLI